MLTNYKQLKKSVRFSLRIFFLKAITGLEGPGSSKNLWDDLYTMGTSVDPVTCVLLGFACVAAYAAYRYFRNPSLEIPDSSVSNLIYERTPGFKAGFNTQDPYENISFTPEETLLLQKFDLNAMFNSGQKWPRARTSKSIISDLLEENPIYQALDSGKDINWSDTGSITQSYLISIKNYYFMLNPNSSYTLELASKIAHLADLCTELLLLLHTYG